MAFVLDNDPILDSDCSAYISTWDTEEQLTASNSFCPLCEIPDSFTTSSGNRPIAQLNKVIDDLKAENKLSPAGFVRFVCKYYNEVTRGHLVNVLNWQRQTAESVSEPPWYINDVYSHFSEHVADIWFSRQEALRQTNCMLKRTANTCLTKDGPPNPNTVRTFVELNKLRESLSLNQIQLPKEILPTKS